MWPWEHAIVGYVAYSLCCHAFARDSPGGLEAVAVAVASVLPDLVDKPLSWEYGVFESGFALGHSAFVAVPLAIGVGFLARAVGRPRVGVAFGVGYLLHIPGDVVYDYARGGALRPELMLWPLVTPESATRGAGFVEVLSGFLADFRAELLSGDPSTYMLVSLGAAACAAALWVYDGAPPVPEAIGFASDVAVRMRAHLVGGNR